VKWTAVEQPSAPSWPDNAISEVSLGHLSRGAVVAGAPAIIAGAMGLELVGRGYRVLLGVPNVDELEDPLGVTREDVGAASCFALDLDDQRSVESFVERSVEAVGGIDVLVVGTGAPTVGDFAADASENFVGQILVDLVRSHRLVAQVLPLMLSKGHGDIVFIAAGDSLPPNTYVGAFGTAEPSTSAMAKSLRSELAGTGVRIGYVQIGPTSLDSAYQLGQEPQAVLSGSPPREALRHNNLLRPADIARAVTFIIEAPDGSQVAALRIQPEAPISVASNG
jgi:serine 3-dehydrogenase